LNDPRVCTAESRNKVINNSQSYEVENAEQKFLFCPLKGDKISNLTAAK
jgi:hypothetical protein